jgi:hypothetical protein
MCIDITSSSRLALTVQAPCARPLRILGQAPSREWFTSLDALAALTSFIPEKGQQIVRYYAFYRNKARGKRRRQSAAGVIPGAALCPDAVQDDELRMTNYE